MFAFIFSVALFIATHCHDTEKHQAPNDCSILVEQFSNSSSEFTMCATRNSKPILLCRKCFDKFLNVRSAYRAIESNHMTGVNCKRLLDGKDRLQILIRTWESIGGKFGLWSKGHWPLLTS